ncbi:hypothetical protein [Azospirillum doebereinerae]
MTHAGQKLNPAEVVRPQRPGMVRMAGRVPQPSGKRNATVTIGA